MEVEEELEKRSWNGGRKGGGRRGGGEEVEEQIPQELKKNQRLTS